MLENCNIYGSGTIYGSGLIYADYCRVLCYDFGIDVYDETTSLPLSGFWWSLYRRDENKPHTSIIDETHILVDSGQSLESLLRINLNTYTLRNIDTDFLLTASMESSASSASDISRVYVKYYHTDSIQKSKYPYLQAELKFNTKCHGEIVIEPNRWQLVSIPVEYGYWDQNSHKLVHNTQTYATIYNYVVLQIEDVYGVPASSMVEVFNTYIGTENFYYNFVPGKTNPSSIHNFKLAYRDGLDIEYTGFWVKSVHDHTFVIRY